jgi:hypothetical protein
VDGGWWTVGVDKEPGNSLANRPWGYEYIFHETDSFVVGEIGDTRERVPTFFG